jgi:hypothetical protein
LLSSLYFLPLSQKKDRPLQFITDWWTDSQVRNIICQKIVMYIKHGKVSMKKTVDYITGIHLSTDFSIFFYFLFLFCVLLLP